MRKSRVRFVAAISIVLIGGLAFAQEPKVPATKKDEETKSNAKPAVQQEVAKPTELANLVLIVYKVGGPSDWAAAAIIRSVESMGGVARCSRFGDPEHMKVVQSHLKDGYANFVKAFKDEDILIIPLRKEGKGAYRVATAELFGPNSPLALAKRPGDALVLRHAGEKKAVIEHCKVVAEAAQLKFDAYDVTTPNGVAMFNRRMAKFAPATRLKLIQESGAMYLQRGWAMEDDTIVFSEPQELSTLVPVADVATLFVSKTTDPVSGRKSPPK